MLDKKSLKKTMHKNILIINIYTDACNKKENKIKLKFN